MEQPKTKKYHLKQKTIKNNGAKTIVEKDFTKDTGASNTPYQTKTNSAKETVRANY